MGKISLCFLILVFLACPALLSAEEISLTIDDAIAIALRDNRDILLKTEDVEKVKAEIEEAESGLLPTLNLTGTYYRTAGYYKKNVNQTSAQATLKQYLYKGGETVNTIKYNGSKLEVKKALLDKEKLDVILDVKKAFCTLLLAKEFTDLNKQIVENTKRHLETTEARYTSGQASESDILQLKESLAGVEEAYEASLSQVESSQALLKNLLYLDEEAEITAEGEFDYEPREVAYDEAFLAALQRRPEIRQYNAQEEADKHSIEIARAGARPDIYASWDYYSRSHSGVTPEENWNDYNVIGVTFSWPIFDGFATKAKVEQAIVDLKTTQLTREKTVKDIALELKDAYILMKDAVAKIRTTESDIIVYKDNLSGIEQKYRDGIASVLDLEDASLRYNIVLFNKNQAIYDYIIAKETFDRALGGV